MDQGDTIDDLRTQKLCKLPISRNLLTKLLFGQSCH